ncbi:MAG: hypothetical protein CMH83_06020 [Nocardioides sp.]|nr:hypothetical protein [Nocardioides sp.]
MRLAVGAAAGVALGVAGLAGLSAAFAEDATTEPPSPTSSTVELEVNEFGETYGSAEESKVDPDLVRAIATNGTVGYVRASDLNGPEPLSPEEAVQMTLDAQKAGARMIPVYERDGRTVIGEFKVLPPLASVRSSSDGAP